MHTIIVRNVLISDLRELREEAESRDISLNDLSLEMIKDHVAQFQKAKTRRKAA